MGGFVDTQFSVNYMLILVADKFPVDLSVKLLQKSLLKWIELRIYVYFNGDFT